MYTPPTCRASPSATSSPASAAGPSRFARLDGVMTDLFGPVPVRANLSARQAKALGLLMSGTYGRTSSTSSGSSALQASLENRLRARTQRLGSTLYTLTWKAWATPSGVSRSRLRASVRRTSEIAITGWPTPTATLAEKGVRTFEGGLLEAMRNHGPDLAAAACLAGWVTPTTRDWKDTPGMVAQRDGKDRNDQLPRQAYLCGWPTPMAGTPAQNGHNMAGNNDFTRKTMALCGAQVAGANIALSPDWGAARLTVHGEMLTGCSAGMPSGGQLRPGHSRWLMGYPEAWDRAAPYWSDWQAWQALITQASREPSPTE